MTDRPDEARSAEEQADRVLAEWDRTFVTWRGRTFVRNPALPYALAGLAVGLLLTAGLAVAGRGGTVVVSLLQLGALLLPVVCLLLVGLSLARRGRGRRAAWRTIGAWAWCLLALLVLKVAAAAGLDSGVRGLL